MTPEDALRVYKRLESHGVVTWIEGGWGIDALLEEQTREHKDLDVIVDEASVARLKGSLAEEGFEKAEGTDTGFLLHDALGLRVDVRVVSFDPSGNAKYRPRNGDVWDYPAEGFTGRGKILGVEVRCLSPTVQMICHTGYPLAEKDVREMALLHERFGVAYPDQFSKGEE